LREKNRLEKKIVVFWWVHRQKMMQAIQIITMPDYANQKLAFTWAQNVSLSHSSRILNRRLLLNPLYFAHLFKRAFYAICRHIMGRHRMGGKSEENFAFCILLS